MTPISHWAMICGILSLISILIAFLVFLIIQKRVSSFFAKLAIYLLMADVPFLIISFFGIPVTEPISMFHCETVSFVLQFSNLSTIFWNLIIIWTVYHTIRYNLIEEELFTYNKKFLGLSYGVPILIAVIPLLIHLGTNSSCWIESSSDESMEYYVYNGFYLLSFSGCFVIILSYYIRLFIFLKQFTIEEVSGEFYKLMVFPIILLVVNLPDATDRILTIVFGTNVASWIISTQVILRQSQALCNSILFLLSPRVTSGIRRYLRSRRKKRQQLMLSGNSVRGNSGQHLDEEDSASVSSIDEPVAYIDRSEPRRMTDNPELIYKMFDSKSSFSEDQKNKNRSMSARIL